MSATASLNEFAEAWAQIGDLLAKGMSFSIPDVTAEPLIVERECIHGVSVQTNVYRAAAGRLGEVLAMLPDDAPRSAVNALEFARLHFDDLGESQSPDFLADDERVDISDVIPIDDTPYDEDATETEETD